MSRSAKFLMSLSGILLLLAAWRQTRSFWKTLVVGGLCAVLTFGRQIWTALSDQWARRLATRIDQLLTIQASGYGRRYAEYLFNRLRYDDQKGFRNVGAFVVNLETAYVELLMGPTATSAISPDPIKVPVLAPLSPHAALMEWLNADPTHLKNFAIIGPPGTGKTTLLKHLAFQARFGGSPLNKTPVFLRVPDLTTSIDETARSLSLLDVIGELLRDTFPPPEWWRRRLETGGCVVMFDGLDEVSDERFRSMAAWIERQTQAFGANCFVVTSRPNRYKGHELAGFTVLTVLPLTMTQVKRFVVNWYFANEVYIPVGMSAQRAPDERRQRAQDLINRIIATPTLQDLAVSPLLLALIAGIHREGKPLPNRQVDLIARICEVSLLRCGEADRSLLNLSVGARTKMLGALAYEMQCRDSRDMATDDVEMVVARALETGFPAATAQAFLRSVRDASGLLVERENDRQEFCHLTFRDYLAARYIKEAGLVDHLRSRVQSTNWHETIRLYCAQADATPIIAECLAASMPTLEMLALAIDCEANAKSVSGPARSRLRAITTDALEHSDPNRRLLAAEGLLARRLARFQVLDETISIDLAPVTHAEYQLFADEKWKSGENRTPDHWNGTRFPLGEGDLPVVGILDADAFAFCKWLEQRAGHMSAYMPASAEELTPFLGDRKEWSGLNFVGHRNRKKGIVLSGDEILEQLFIDARETTAGAELTRAIVRLHQRLVWFALWSALHRAKRDHLEGRSLGLEISFAFDAALNRRLNPHLDRAKASEFDTDLSRATAREFDDDFERLRFRSGPVDVFVADPRARAWDIDLRINQDQDRAIARTVGLGPDRSKSIVRAAHVLNWLCLLEKRARGEFRATEALWLKRVGINDTELSTAHSTSA